MILVFIANLEEIKEKDTINKKYPISNIYSYHRSLNFNIIRVDSTMLIIQESGLLTKDQKVTDSDRSPSFLSS